MIILISAIILLGIVTYYFHRRDLKKQVKKTNKIVQTEIQEPPQECCGRHLVCERDSLLTGVSKTIEYYDDEELDAWKGIEPDSYTPEQIELFREIFYTLDRKMCRGGYAVCNYDKSPSPSHCETKYCSLSMNKERSTNNCL